MFVEIPNKAMILLISHDFIAIELLRNILLKNHHSYLNSTPENKLKVLEKLKTLQ